MRSRLTDWLNGEVRPSEEKGPFRLGVFFLLLGVACRLYVYLLDFPIWRDEASLGLNFAARDFCTLLHQLDNFQVAPLLFLWIEKAVYQCAGTSPLLLRLMPLLAGLAALGLFWRLARQCLEPLPAALAVGFLAAAQTPIHLASMVKPYSFDLLAAVMLLLLAVRYLREPQRCRSLVVLALVMPFVVTLSYPAVFVAAAVSLVLLPVVWQQGSRAGRCWFVVLNVLCITIAAAQLHFVGREIHDPTAPTVQSYMAEFWKGGFLPRQPLPALRWLALCHVSHLFSYPLAVNGGGLLGLLLCLVGVHALYRKRQLGLLALCLLPFALNLVAAVMRRYPYAGDQRLEQHLVPGICLLLGAGVAELIQRVTASAAWRKRCAACVAGAFVLIALGGAVDDGLHPYHDPEAVWAQDVADHLRQVISPADRIVLVPPERFTMTSIRWQLLTFGEQVSRADAIDGRGLERQGGRIWFVDPMLELSPLQREPHSHDPRSMVAAVEGTRWRTIHHVRLRAIEPGPSEQVFHYCCDLHLLEPDRDPVHLATLSRSVAK